MAKKTKKSRKIDLRKISPTKVYNDKEIAKDLMRKISTVQRWRREGLPVIDGTNPPLVDGAELLAWHKKRRDDRKRPCAENEFYCFTCKVQRTPKMGSVVVRPVNTKRLSLDAECGTCGGDMSKGGAMANIDAIETALESYMKNVRYIERYRSSPSNGS
ncbi:MAG: hypothetical protein ACSHXY_02835 [Alphaproteobacteria bacterium]